MALPKIDTPVYDIDLPLSKKNIRFRPFLVKEQRNLMMAMESDDKETIEKNIKQVLHNCTLSDIVIDELPIIDVEYYFLQLRARSVGETIDTRYRCENLVQNPDKPNPTPCNNVMKTSINLLDIKVNKDEKVKDVVQLNSNLSMKLRYPQFSIVEKASRLETATDLAFNMVVDSIEYIFDGEQYYYAKETPQQELIEFVESLNQEQFALIEDFFNNLPTLNKTIELDCSKCGFHHTIDVEGLESFFG
jgi:hypothetical protein